jgi:hypothetical protein
MSLSVIQRNAYSSAPPHVNFSPKSARLQAQT